MKNGTKLILAAFVFGGFSSAAMAQDAGDAAKGENVFKRCQACHMVGEGAQNRVGPVLNEVIGREAGTIEGFNYSPLNKSAGEAGLVWTADLIVEYLADPNKFLKDFLTEAGKADQARGTTRMAFRLPKEDERRDVVAYLQQFSPESEEPAAEEQPAEGGTEQPPSN